jgi:putative ABC transport system permease protein
VGDLTQDVRFAFRFLIKRPGISLLAVLCLAIGIGANAAIFSPVDLFMIRPFPFPDANQLVVSWLSDLGSGGRDVAFSLRDFVDYRVQSKTLELAAAAPRAFNLSSSDEPERLEGQVVSANLFRVLGISPLIGRGFHADEEHSGAAPVAVLSYPLWERRFGADRRVLGERIKLDGMPYTVIGVMPKGFGFPNAGSQIWTPLAVDAPEPRDSRWLATIGRLVPGASIDRARAELAAIASRLERSYPETNRRLGATVSTVRDDLFGREFFFGSLISSVATAFLLLIAAANVANLLLAQAAGREREIAIRTALGAGRGRIVRQLLTESLLLGLASGVVAVGFAYAGVQGLRTIMPPWFPRVNEIGLDARVLVFGAVVSLVAAAISGAGPAFQATRQSVRESLQDGSRGSSIGRRGGRLRGVFVTAQIALAVALVVGAGLLVKGYIALQSEPLGFDSRRMLSLVTTLPPTKYAEDADMERFREQVVAQVRDLPGVEAVASASGLPGTGASGTSYGLEGEDQPDGHRPTVAYRSVSPGYFAAMGATLVKGREFTQADRGDAPLVAVANEAFVRRHWKDGDPIGKRITLASGPREIVGVVRDIREYGPSTSPMQAFVYFPTAQHPARTIGLAIRTTGNPLALVQPVRDVVRGLDPDQPLFGVMTMARRMELQAQGNAVVSRIMIVLAGVALALALVGVYGVVSYSVSQRTQEIGIRLALGAGSRDVLGMVVRQSARVVALGGLIGVGLALAMGKGLAVFLFGVSPFDPTTFTLVPLALTAAAILASYLPARRATRVDPLTALRAE